MKTGRAFHWVESDAKLEKNDLKFGLQPPSVSLSRYASRPSIFEVINSLIAPITPLYAAPAASAEIETFFACGRQSAATLSQRANACALTRLLVSLNITHTPFVGKRETPQTCQAILLSRTDRNSL